ncbi:MAG: hypothetical protein RR101_07965 [Burkholderiaceae bacterium]
MEPELPLLALETLKTRLAGARVFLEYGAGGSTVIAARWGVATTVSVESSPEWVSKVEAAVAEAKLAANTTSAVHVLHADIGKTGDWGRPIDRKAIERWHLYPAAGWQRLRELGLSPDLVLIDGRFRVACFCVSLLSARPGAVILFDDYVNRPGYHVVESFCPVVARHDRMAEFQVPERVDTPAVLACLLSRLHEPD